MTTSTAILSQSGWLGMVLIGVFALVGLLTWMLTYRAPRSAFSPRRLKRLSRVAFYLGLPVFGLMAYVSTQTGDYKALAVWALIMTVNAHSAFRRETHKETLANFIADEGRRCGRCGYDLTGNVSGMCPECGWEIPLETSKIQRPDWRMWWRNWEIDYLDNWKRNLAEVGGFTAAFAGVAAWLFLFKNEGGVAVVALVMAGMGLINCVRVTSYARRTRNTDPPDAATLLPISRPPNGA